MRANGELKLKSGDQVMVDSGAFTASPSPTGDRFVACQLGDYNGCGQWYVFPHARGWSSLYVFSNFIRLRCELPAGAVVVL